MDLSITCAREAAPASCSHLESLLLGVGMAATGDLLFVGGQDSADGIFAFRFDAGSGSLTPLGSALDASSPIEHVNDGEAVGDGGLLASSSDGRFLFATATDSAAAFAIDEASGALSRLGTVPTAIPCPASVALADGLLLLPCYLGGGGVAVVERRADGTLGEEVQTIGPFGAGSNADAARQEEAHPHSGWLSPLGARTVFLVPDLGSDKVRSFVVDVSAKRLVPAGELDLAPGSGPRHLDFHPTLPM
jgi:6-phosphogluconolactonase